MYDKIVDKLNYKSKNWSLLRQFKPTTSLLELKPN